MEQFTVETIRGRVICQPAREKIISTHKGERFSTVDEVVEAVFPKSDENIVSCIERRKLQKAISDKLVQVYRKAYREATRPTSTLHKLKILCGLGVRVGDISLPCSNADCTNECATTSASFQNIGEQAEEAIDNGKFTEDLICPVCRTVEGHEAEEEQEAERKAFYQEGGE